MPEFELLEYGALGVLAAAFLMTLRWMLTSHQKAIENVQRQLNRNSAVIIGLQQQLLAHDLTVHGLNPSAGADVDERTNRAYAKYRELQKTMDELRSTLLGEKAG